MNKKFLFGCFLKQKRIEKGITLRELGKSARLSHTYIRNIENGNKPPPSDKALIRLANALLLDKPSRDLFYDFAAISKQESDDGNIYIPVDLLKSLSQSNDAKFVIRAFNEAGVTNEFWKTIRKNMEK